MRYEYRGAQALIDYAHNPEGLAGLMNVAARLRRTGRLELQLGQAGNRPNADIERLASTAASFRPDFVGIKETEAYLRGRTPGEAPAVLRPALVRFGLHESALETCRSELEGKFRPDSSEDIEQPEAAIEGGSEDTPLIVALIIAVGLLIAIGALTL